jgi:glutamine synthetase
MTTAKDVLKMMKDDDVKYVDLRFTDPRGKWQHVTFDKGMVDEDMFSEGMMFDGSSIAGWKAINESDMCLMPDPATAVIDPFFAETTLSIVCDILEPTTGEPYNRDPRGIAKKAEAMVKSMGVGDQIFFGPEAEFFVFDDVRFKADPYNTGYKVDSIELPTSATALTPRPATSRSRRRIRRRTCAARCSPRWPRWAPRSRSITMRWPRPSMSSA